MAAATVPVFTIGENVSVEVKDGKAVITLDLAHNGGKTGGGNTRVATTGGNALIPGTNIKLGLNAYSKP